MKLSSAVKFVVPAAVAILTLGLMTPSASASTTVNTTFAVSATVQATCTISAGPMAFGIYTGTAVSSTSSVTVQCTNTTPYTVGLDKGLGSGASVTNRLMTNGSATLGYALFSDTARTVNWGQTSGTDTVAGTGSGSVQTLTVYGKIAGSLYVTPGSYTDTITASITY